MSRRRLGKSGRIAVTDPAGAAQRRVERLDERQALQTLNRGLFGPVKDEDTGVWGRPEYRCGSCGMRRDTTVTFARDADGRATVRGLETCGSPWACGHCAAKIRAGRAEEIGTILRLHLEGGGGAVFVTLTNSHTRDERALAAFDDGMTAWRKMVKTRRWRRLIEHHGITGFIRVTEVTHSFANGWHPHHHIALLLDKPISYDDFDGGDLEVLRCGVGELWAFQVTQFGRTVHQYYGVTAVIIRDGEGIGNYVSKIELELARSDIKRGRETSRSAWQIGLDAVTNGEAADFALWREYVAATHGRRSISCSRGLCQRYGITEVDDETLAEETTEADTVVVVDGEVFDQIDRASGVAELRQLIEAGAEVYVLVAAVERQTGRMITVVDDDGRQRMQWADLRPGEGGRWAGPVVNMSVARALIRDMQARLRAERGR